jgi:uncharacterized protein (TIRG00374 family)
VIVLVLAVVLLALFLRRVDMRGVLGEIVRARPEWLVLSLVTVVANLAVRAWRWQYLLEPLGRTTFGRAFRATAVGFAANSILPVRAGEVIRPYFLARQQGMSATGAFATIILERVLDMLTVLMLLAVYVFLVGHDMNTANPAAFTAVKWAAAMAAAVSVGVLAVLFVLAGNPVRLGHTLAKLEQLLPSRLAGLLAKIAEKFARGLAAVRRPRRLFVALLLSVPLWLCIALGIWAAVKAFHLPVPFTGSFLLQALLVIGVAVPTPGAVGGFHEAFRIGLTVFFGAPNDAAVGSAIILHAISMGPVLLLGLLFAAQEGLNVAGMRQLADQTESGRTG